MEQPREVTWSIPDHCLWNPNMLTMALACPYDDNKVDNTVLSPFYRVDCSVKGNVLLSIIITPLSQNICIVPFYRWENGGMESWSHLTAFLMQELWEQRIPAQCSSCLLSSQREASWEVKEAAGRKCVPACDCDRGMGVCTLTGRHMGRGSVEKTRREESGSMAQVSPDWLLSQKDDDQ